MLLPPLTLGLAALITSASNGNSAWYCPPASPIVAEQIIVESTVTTQSHACAIVLLSQALMSADTIGER